MAKTKISLNYDQPTQLQFDVNVDSRMDGNGDIKVRFVVMDVNGINASIDCTQDKDQWNATVPMLPDVNGKKFKIEVIVDEFYFEPISGIISTSAVKPNVNAKIVKAAKVNEQVGKLIIEGAPPEQGQTIPAGNQLVPEFPAASNEKSSLVHDDDEQELDDGSISVAERIIQDMVGKAAVPSTGGKLFTRDKSGKVMVPGLHSQELKEHAITNARRVREILNK